MSIKSTIVKHLNEVQFAITDQKESNFNFHDFYSKLCKKKLLPKSMWFNYRGALIALNIISIDDSNRCNPTEFGGFTDIIEESDISDELYQYILANKQ